MSVQLKIMSYKSDWSDTKLSKILPNTVWVLQIIYVRNPKIYIANPSKIHFTSTSKCYQ